MRRTPFADSSSAVVQTSSTSNIVNYDAYAGSTNFTSMISIPSDCQINGSNA